MAAGIDAPLYWGLGGPRHADDVVRDDSQMLCND